MRVSADGRHLIAHELAQLLHQRDGSAPRMQRQFDRAGGDIRNGALEAAFPAADEGCVIGMRPIVHALARQSSKQGKTPTGSDFHHYQCLLG